MRNWEKVKTQVKDAGSIIELQTKFPQSKELGSYITLAEQLKSAIDSLSLFMGSHGKELPDYLHEDWLRGKPGLYEEHLRDQMQGLQRTQASYISIMAFVSKVDYCISESNLEASSITERAFSHLQRSIHVLNSVRGDWISAHALSEPACEGLGAIHLMLHGIFAFKANAAGSATDLVYQDMLDTSNAGASSAKGLVLTEWKRHTKTHKVEDCISEALNQISLYRHGLLAPNELRSISYAVIISEDHIRLPFKEDTNSYVVKFINIAVNPSTASAAARRM